MDSVDPAESAPPGWPHFDDDEIEAAMAPLRSGKVNYWTGTQGRSFEEEFAAAMGARAAVAVANGTVALEVGLEALGVGPGDEVVVTPRTFVATASAVVRVGATPVFADVDPVTQGITAATVEPVLSDRTRAVIVVHLGGWPGDVAALRALCDQRGIAVMEDCAQAHGAAIGGRRVGGLGTIAAWSFCQDKIMTTGGEGGMITTNDEALAESVWALKDHGKSFDAVYRRDHPPGFRWLHEGIGTNARMTESQSAIGRVQLTKLDRWVDTRRSHAARLDAAFADVEALRLTIPPADIHHAYYRHYAFVRPERLAPGWDRDRIIAEVAAKGQAVFSGSCGEVYRERAFVERGLAPAEPMPVAAELGDTSLAFLVHPTLEARHIDAVAEAVIETVAAATA
ncbi:MAG: DegT/DnrJ/EryC1/StrS aminotransferase family protein [Acidimicrobiales bacterium]